MGRGWGPVAGGEASGTTGPAHAWPLAPQPPGCGPVFGGPRTATPRDTHSSCSIQTKLCPTLACQEEAAHL